MSQESIVSLGPASTEGFVAYSINQRVLEKRTAEAYSWLSAALNSKIPKQIKLAEAHLDQFNAFSWLIKANENRKKQLPIFDPETIERCGDRVTVAWQEDSDIIWAEADCRKTHYQACRIVDYDFLLPNDVLRFLAQFADAINRVEIWVPFRSRTRSLRLQILIVMRVGAYYLYLESIPVDTLSLFDRVLRRLSDKLLPMVQAQIAFSSSNKTSRGDDGK